MEMKDSGIEWIGDIPNDCECVPIKYNYTLIAGATPDSSNCAMWDGEIIWITPADFKTKDIYVAEGARKITDMGYKTCSTSIVPAGSIIFSKRAPIGSVVISQNELCTNQGCLSLVAKNDLVNNKYYYYVLSIYDDVFNLYGSGTTFKEISSNTFSNIKLPSFPRKKQDNIAIFLDSKCSEIDSLISDIQSEITTLEEYKKSVITEAVTKGLNPDVSMKDSGIEWIGEIPEDWEIKRGKYIFTQRNERGNERNLQLLSPTQKYGVIPQDMYEELSGMVAVKLNDNVNLAALKTIHKGDYCISLRSFQGGFEYSDYEGVVSPAYQVFFNIEPISKGYYKYLFKERSFIDVMNSYAMSLRDGKNIAFSDFGNTYIPYPSIESQEEIAKFLDEFCKNIDEILDTKQIQLENLEEYKKSVIYEYVTGKKEVI